MRCSFRDLSYPSQRTAARRAEAEGAGGVELANHPQQHLRGHVCGMPARPRHPLVVPGIELSSYLDFLMQVISAQQPQLYKSFLYKSFSALTLPRCFAI